MQRLSLLFWPLLLVPLIAAHLHAAEITLRGTVDEGDHASYIELPFELPPDTGRLTVTFDYPRDAGVTIDLGLLDPQRLRGWSGGNKSRFTLSATDATPSYLPGPLPPGEWQLLLGIPNADTGASVDYSAQITFETGPAAHTQPFAPAPLNDAAGWYRGDLHSHTGHSDGQCTSLRGAGIPCPLWRTAATARQRQLDFIAITEHNTRSHFQAQRELQSYFDDLLLLSGQEITTFHGHANLLGSTAFLDFRLESSDATPLVRQLADSGGILSINHPGLPSGKQCMGCGWKAAIDFAAVTAVEVVNGGVLKAAGGRVHSPVSGLPFWERQLAAGHRLTAVAGSDNHNPGEAAGSPGALASPTTVVYARALSQDAVIAGLRSGRVFIDVQGSPDSALALQARSDSGSAVMGGNLRAAAGETVHLSVEARTRPGATIQVWYRQARLEAQALESGDAGGVSATFETNSDGQPGWLRAEVVSADGEPLLISNPVYVNF